MPTAPICLTKASLDEQRARRFWGSVIGILLTSQVTIGVIAVVLSRSDPSQSIVPDYHERALQWDRTVEARNNSDRLGWQVELAVSPEANSAGKHVVTLVVNNASLQPITGCTGNIRLYHRSRVAQAVVLPLDDLASGIYRTEAEMNRTGLWQFEIALSRGNDERYVNERLLDLPGATQ